jgi:hypothetical protein
MGGCSLRLLECTSHDKPPCILSKIESRLLQEELRVLNSVYVKRNSYALDVWQQVLGTPLPPNMKIHFPREGGELPKMNIIWRDQRCWECKYGKLPETRNQESSPETYTTFTRGIFACTDFPYWEAQNRTTQPHATGLLCHTTWFTIQ